jgi:hypothetical protein
VGITLAQQSGEQARRQAVDRTKLRAESAKLRAEVEVLQLEHDADADILKKLMVDLKNLDGIEAAKGPFKEQVEALLKGPLKEQAEALKGQIEALKAAMNGQMPAGLGGLPGPQKELEKEFLLNEELAKLGRPILERLKKEFIQKAAELHEKRLELADVEKRYNAAN